MAFQATSALPTITAASREIWPQVALWKALGSKIHLRRLSTTRESRTSRNDGAMKGGYGHATKVGLFSLSTDLPRSSPANMIPRTASRTVSGASRGFANMFIMSNAISGRGFASQSRHMSTMRKSCFQKPDMMISNFTAIQRRSLFNGGSNRNLLANLEETANRNPNSPSSQYGFYQALIRANMPAIVVERYQTNQFASNAAIENLYHRALGMMGQTETGGIGSQFGTQQFAGQQGNMNNAQLQTIGQAVAATSRGGNVAVSRGPTGSGARDSPLHVVVEETIGSSIFKWAKFLFYFGLVTYLSLIVMTIAVEAFQTIRKLPGAKTDNEAKAEHQTVRFTDVHGCDEAKEELQELVDFLKNPEKFSTLGGKLPKGVLLVGPPGTGKTLLARAVAGEAGVPFFFMSGSEFDEVYVGVGAKRVRELFIGAKAKSPAIVFIDELDAIGGKRNARDAAYVKQTLNQLLTELDGFEQNSGVIILAATNFPEMLDKALTRPGRFDRNVVVGLPDVRGRIAILGHHMKNVIAGKDVSLEALAAGTPGFSGAELENVINQAAVHASKAKAQAVSMLDFEWAKDKVMMGAERKSMVITQKEKEMTAYHEAGHALIRLLNPNTPTVHKITIMPRGEALGMVTHLPEIDKYSQGRNEFEAHIDVCLGGKVAEELVYGPDRVTSGASSDLTQATRIAYAMATSYGMSPALGNVDLASNHDKLSTETKQLIESEVRRFIEEGRVRATKLLTERRKELDLLAHALLDYETLNGDEASKVIKGEKLEGKFIMPSGPVKIPHVGPNIGGNSLPEVPQIPGSEASRGDSKEPPAGPAGGAIA